MKPAAASDKPPGVTRLASLWLAAAALLAGCGAIPVGPQATVPARAEIRRVAPQQAERLYSIMVPADLQREIDAATGLPLIRL